MSTSSWFELRFASGIETEQAVEFMRSLGDRGRAGFISSVRPVAFEIHASSAGTRWLVGLPDAEASGLQARLESWLPGVAVVPVVRNQEPAASMAVELRLRSQRRALRAELQPEISRVLLDQLGSLRRGERLTVQWLVGGWLPRSAVPPASTTGRGSGLWGRPVLDSEEVAEARKKQSEMLFACVGRVAVSGATARRSRELISGVVGAYQLLRVSGAGLSRRSMPSWCVRSRSSRMSVNQLDPPCVLRADELTAVLGWPIGLADDVELRGVELNRARLLRPDRRVLRPDADDRSLRIVAESAYPSAPGSLVLPPAEALRHLHVLGPTGVGKSTLLAQLICQDIEVGRGVAVVDPKGDLIDDVLAQLSPKGLERSVLLDPSDEAPVGLDVIGSVGGSGVDGILGVMHSLWASSWGPRLHDVLHAGLLTLATEPGHSLVELPVLLTNPRHRRRLVSVASERDPLGLGGFWAWFDDLSPDATSQVLGPVMNKLRAFVVRPSLRAVLGQAEPRFSIRQVFTERRVLLVRLPKGVLGAETAALLGSLVVHQLWQATLERAALPPVRRHPVFVYLDEFQDVMRLPVDIGDALVQARGLGVGLVLAHQHLAQLSPEMRAAVMANAGSRVAFRLDHDDASVIAKRSGGRLQAEDFTNLPPFHAYADLAAEGTARGFASARTRPLGRPRRELDEVRAANRRRWGVPRAETEARLRRLLEDSPGKESEGLDGGFGIMPGDGGGS